MTVGTHRVLVLPDPADDPAGTPVDLSCWVDDLAITHGRGDTEKQPDPASCTINLTVTPTGDPGPLPAAVEMGAWVAVVTHLDGTDYPRFRGRVTDVAIGWDDAGEATPEHGIGQVIAVSPLADYARRMIGDEPWPQELDGARVARVFALAGVSLDPFASDPGVYDLIPRDVDRQDALGIAQGAADSAGGLVWHTRDGEIRYADAEHRRGIEVTVDLDACDVLVTPTWSRNLAGLVNEVTLTYGVTPEDGSQPSVTAVNTDSQARYGRYEYSATVELADAFDATAAAAQIVGMNGGPVWVLSSMPVDVAGLDPAQTAKVLALEMHDLVRVAGLPATGPTPTSVAAWVEGWQETLAWGVHDLELIVSGYCRTSPAPRWNDLPPTLTWDSITPAGTTWDAMHCFGPPADEGRWDQVPASTRWDQVPPDVSWDETAEGVPGALVPA